MEQIMTQYLIKTHPIEGGMAINTEATREAIPPRSDSADIQ